MTKYLQDDFGQVHLFALLIVLCSDAAAPTEKVNENGAKPGMIREDCSPKLHEAYRDEDDTCADPEPEHTQRRECVSKGLRYCPKLKHWFCQFPL